jgi:hypothetical protein
MSRSSRSTWSAVSASHYACMPSKALLRPGELLPEASRVPGAREPMSGALDVEAVLARRDEVIHDLDDSIQLPWLKQRNVTLVRGRGRLDGERSVPVGERLLEARLAVIVATGSGAAIPPIPGLRETEHRMNREATTSKSVPVRLVILGGEAARARAARSRQAVRRARGASRSGVHPDTYRGARRRMLARRSRRRRSRARGEAGRSRSRSQARRG